MRRMLRFLRLAGMIGAIAMVAGCTYSAAIQRLPAQEQMAFRAYSKMMTSGQARTYLTQATAAERTAYLEKIGLSQRFQALDPQDRETVLSGFPRQGMSAEALYFLWGRPQYADGPIGYYEYWYYRGSTWTLGQRGNSPSEAGTIVVVHLANGRVTDWLETIPSEPAEDSSGGGRLFR